MGQSNIERFEEDLKGLTAQGRVLLEDLSKNREKAYDFNTSYQNWYSEALEVIKQIIPSRFIEFTELYYGEKRKDITSSTYTIKDWLLGIRAATEPLYGGKKFDDFAAAIMRFQSQVSILESATQRFKSSLFDIEQTVRADLFDSELDAASHLNGLGFVRAAGAMAGVVIESHLQQVCANHDVKISKKNPSINDLADLLKSEDVVGVPEWRKLYHLADLRNLCDHKKAADPTADEIDELLKGTEKLIKTLF